MDTENVGFLLHKLTKYQTLHSNSRSNEKRSLYQQKISQYMNKLEACGADKETLNQMGGLIGGAGENYEFVIKNLIADQKKRIAEKVADLKKKDPADTTVIDNINKRISDADTKVSTMKTTADQIKVKITNAQSNYKNTIKELVNAIRELLIALTSLEKDLEGVYAGNAQGTLTAITNVLEKLEQTLKDGIRDLEVDGQTPGDIKNYIVDTYYELLLRSMEKNPGVFIETKNGLIQHSDQLSVEMRQLAHLLGLIKSTYTDNDDAKNNVVEPLFKKFITNSTSPAQSQSLDKFEKSDNKLINKEDNITSLGKLSDNLVTALKELAKKWSDKDKTPTLKEVVYTKSAAPAASPTI